MKEPNLTLPAEPPRAAGTQLHPLLRVALYLLTFWLIQAGVAAGVAGIAFLLGGEQLGPDSFLASREAILAVFGLAVLPVLGVTQIFVRLLDRRRLASVGVRWPGGGRRAALRGLVTMSLGSGALLTGWLLLLLALTAHHAALHFGGLSRDLATGRPWWPLPRLLLFPVLLALFFIQAGIEELVVRGYVYHVLRERWRAGAAALGSSLLFSLLHAGNPDFNAVALVNIVLAGLILAALVERSGSLWGATAAHGVWNFAVACLASLPVSGISLFHLFNVAVTGDPRLTGGDFGPEGSLVLTALALPLAAGLWWWIAPSRGRPREDAKPSAAEDGAPALSSGGGAVRFLQYTVENVISREGRSTMKAAQPVFSLAVSCFLLASGLAAAAPPARSAVNDPGTIHEAVDVNVVNVEVYVTDASGKPVTGLRERDFEVREDGRRVSISNFAALAGSGVAARKPAAPADRPEAPGSTSEPAAEPWSLIVFVDNFDIHPASRTRALRQVREFLANHLAAEDRVMVASLDAGLRIWLPFSTDRAAVDASLKSVEGLAAQGPSIDRARRQAYQNIMTIQEAALSVPNPHACPQEISRPAHDFAAARRNEVFHTLGGLTVLINSLSGVPGRKALLYVSDGLPVTPGEEVFQFLAEICGGGSGTGGIGRQAVVNTPNTIEEPGNDEGTTRPKPSDDRVKLDPMAVYDARTLGPGAYQAASQAPLDTQSYNIGKQLEALVAHANAQRVTLYALQASGLAGPGSADADAGPGERLTQFPSIETAARTSNQGSLTALASGTGGRAILDVNDFGLDLARMREDLTTYYSLGYTPSHSGDGKEHRIVVRVKRSGVQLRYRESYRDKPVMEKAVDRTLAALFYGLDDNPLKIEMEVGDQLPGTGGNVSVPVRLKIPLFKVAVLDGEENYEGSLRLLVATRSVDGRMAPVRQFPVPIHIPRKEVLTALGQYYVYTLTLQLAPGEQRVAVGIRDDVAATSSYLSRAVTVGAAAPATEARN
ncbi:MAG TPA: VWA domain-containing protein [Thermoanaerobaculia bacterium]|nr:VWA domain-containing protein [Thermoanaerobaculia bacterium]